MTPDEIRELMALAEKATQGEWQACGHDRGGCKCGQVWSLPADVMVAVSIGVDDENYTNGEGVTPAQKIVNAAYIAAANPERVVALCRLALAALDWRVAMEREHDWNQGPQITAINEAVEAVFGDEPTR